MTSPILHQTRLDSGWNVQRHPMQFRESGGRSGPGSEAAGTFGGAEDWAEERAGKQGLSGCGSEGVRVRSTKRPGTSRGQVASPTTKFVASAWVG